MMKRKTKGSALLIAMFLVIVGILASVFFFSRTDTLLKISGLTMKKTAAQYLEEEALQRGFLKIIAALNASGSVLMPPVEESTFDASKVGQGEVFIGSDGALVVNGYQYQAQRTKDENFDIRYRIKTSDIMGNPRTWNFDASRTFAERHYRIEASVKGKSDGIRLAASQELIVRREPLTNYLWFANDDLELTLDGLIDFHGWIHSNSNIYLDNADDGTSVMNIFGNLTAAGHIVRGYKEGEGPYSRPINIHWGSGASDYASLYMNGPVGMDSVMEGSGFKRIDVSTPGKETVTWNVDPKWVSDTESTFHGVVGDTSQGVVKVKMPDIPSSAPGGYYDNNAQIKFVTSQVPMAILGNPPMIDFKVLDGTGNVLLEKTFSTVVRVDSHNPDDTIIGAAEVPMVSGEINQLAPSSDVATYAISAGGPRRGNSPALGNLVSAGHPLCGQAFKQARHWNGQEDMFVYTTDIDVAQLQKHCNWYPSDGLIYATRTDAVADTTMDTLQVEDPNRKPYGYRLVNGATLQNNTPLIFISNDPVWIQGDFNQHMDKTDHQSFSVKDTDGDGIPDLYDTQYNQANDTWQPAAVMADRLFVQSIDYDSPTNVGIHNLRRWVDGRSPAEIGSGAWDHQTKVLHDTEINAAFIAGQPETNEDYTSYIHAGKQQFYAEEGWPPSTPRRSGGIAMFLAPEENYAKSGGGSYKIIFNGSFIKLNKTQFATHYQRRCDGQANQLMGNPQGPDGPGLHCGPWAKGGTGGGWTTFSAPDRKWNHDPRLDHGLPLAIIQLLPCGPTQRVNISPFEAANLTKLEKDPLFQ